MAPFEQLAVGYFLILFAAAYRAPRWRRGVLYVCGAIALVIVARFTLPWAGRAWLAHAYLVLGYWIPAAFVGKPNEAFERWLARYDIAWRQPGAVLELAYLCCYPLVPAAFAIVFGWGSRDDVTWFWTATLASGYACYASLPWIAARPPRLLRHEGEPAPVHAVASLNAMVLGRVSHQLVTFPSGHVAVSIAAAVGVWRVLPEAGAVFGAVALTIAVAAVAGRYHYLMDVLLGVLFGAVIPAAADLVLRRVSI